MILLAAWQPFIQVVAGTTVRFGMATTVAVIPSQALADSGARKQQEEAVAIG